MFRSSIWAALLCLLAAQPAWSVVNFHLKMDDLPQQPVNGLVHPTTGVKFGFTIAGVANTDALYNALGPGSITFVQDPSIEGNAQGVLSVTFPLATPLVQFGLARNTVTAMAAGASVDLFGPANNLLGTLNVPVSPLPTIAEGQFNYTGAAVKRVNISFPQSTLAVRFALDNLVFTTPEPASAGLLLIAGLIFVPRRLRVARVG